MENAYKTLEPFFNEDGTPKVLSQTLVLSNGTYLLDHGLVLSGNTVLRGYTGNPDDVILDGQDKVEGIVELRYSNGNVLSGVTVRRGVPKLPVVNTSFAGAAGICLNGGGLVTNCCVRDCRTPCDKSSWILGGGILVTAPGKVVDTRVENCHIINTHDGGRAYGGGICPYGGSAQAIDCFVTNCSIVAKSNDSYGGGIGGYVEVGDSIVSNCVVTCCAITNAAGETTSGNGGGMAVYGRQTVSDCRIDHCIGGGGALAIVNGSYKGLTMVSGCTISDCACRGIYILNDAHTNRIQNCLIENCVTTGDGYGILVQRASSTTIADTVVRNCLSSDGVGAVRFYSAVDGVVSNCVIEGCASRLDSSYGGALIFEYAQRQLVVDTIIKSNTAYRASIVSSTTMSGTLDDLPKVTLRNCYVHGNKSINACGIYLVNGGTNVVDHCTITGHQGDSVFRYHGFSSASQLKLIVNACALTGNSQNFYYTSGAGYEVAPVTYCCGLVSPTAGTQTAPGSTIPGSNFAVSDDYFADAANLDYRPAGKGVPLVDVDTSAVLPVTWAAGGKKRLDLGDGTYALEKLGNYGVKIVHNNASPRWSGEWPDVGCFEFYQPLGLMLLLR